MHRARALATDAYRSLADGQWALTQAIARARAERNPAAEPPRGAKPSRPDIWNGGREEEGIPGRALNFCIKQDVRATRSAARRDAKGNLRPAIVKAEKMHLYAPTLYAYVHRKFGGKGRPVAGEKRDGITHSRHVSLVKPGVTLSIIHAGIDVIFKVKR